MRLTSSFLTILMSFSFLIPNFACLWDYDTLAMERQKFPDALELMTGKFLRHSKEFYQWRVEDREKRIAAGPSPELYDDLAIAYEKLGNHAKAIEVTLRKEELYPGLYETRANLGTFYIHAGELERGLEQIELAIEINPEAHFGREVYQKHLVDYILSKRKDGKIQLPLNRDRNEHEVSGFVEFIFQTEKTDNAEKVTERAKALKGILGMMRFGNYDSPILLEALGDLLANFNDPREDAKRLAARAYLKASYEVEDEDAKKRYRSKARESMWMQTVHSSTERELSLEALEKTFAKELKEGDAWFKQVAADEKRWIAEGGDVDAKFARKYYRDPNQSASLAPWVWYVMGGGLATLVLLGSVWYSRMLTKVAPPQAG